MDNYARLAQLITKEQFISATLSDIRKKSIATYRKVDGKPVVIKQDDCIQLTYYYRQKVLHRHYSYQLAIEEILRHLNGYFKQALIHTRAHDYHILANKNAQLKIKTLPATKRSVDRAHDVKRDYLLSEGHAVDFLVELGIMDETGKVKAQHYHKFRQINRYLEFIDDAVTFLAPSQCLRIVDFGCGKAYLSFALYYFLAVKRGLAVKITGLDRKADVIHRLNQLRQRLNYQQLEFVQGDIADFQLTERPDMVISLHACDTATDEAIAKAVAWRAKVIMAVPCCQQEAFDQIKQPRQEVLLRHGIIKQKLASLITDASRAKLLDALGYQADVVEFIDLADTPKNIMIRAFYNGKYSEEALAQYEDFCRYWSVALTLKRKLADNINQRGDLADDKLSLLTGDSSKTGAETV